MSDCYECGDKGAITICARHHEERAIGQRTGDASPVPEKLSRYTVEAFGTDEPASSEATPTPYLATECPRCKRAKPTQTDCRSCGYISPNERASEATAARVIELEARVRDLEQHATDMSGYAPIVQEKIAGVSTSPMTGSAMSAGGPTKPARQSGEGAAVLGEGEEDYPTPANPSRPGHQPQVPERISGDGGERPALYRCRTCGCLWRENGDDTWSLADERQVAKGCCDNVTELIPNLERVSETPSPDDEWRCPRHKSTRCSVCALDIVREQHRALRRPTATACVHDFYTIEADDQAGEEWVKCRECGVEQTHKLVRESPTNCGPVVELKKLREEVTRLRAGLCEALGAWERLDVEKRDWVRIDSLSVACGLGSADCASQDAGTVVHAAAENSAPAAAPDAGTTPNPLNEGPPCDPWGRPYAAADSSSPAPAILPADTEQLDEIMNELAWPPPSKEWFKKYIAACRAGARAEERDRCAFLVAENKDPKTTLDMILRPRTAKDRKGG
jgi:hypothetical protein